MSMGAYRWALGWDGLKSSEKFVLVMIADHYNDKVHRSWPSIERLARETALHRTTVMRAIKLLETHDLVHVEPWVRADMGGSLTNRYCLPMYDKKSQRAQHLPVVSYANFDNDGQREYDTFPHQWQHGEEVPSYAAGG
ncbi:helix-turn-helix domain-containing protein [Leucobacter sp. Z1108]|uniref:helix-turn-helix domain-containing protein n=1 Tax=Leucobacter sp. Z1108 TaxID=3439066 RepID=UPI003F344A54